MSAPVSFRILDPFVGVRFEINAVLVSSERDDAQMKPACPIGEWSLLF